MYSANTFVDFFVHQTLEDSPLRGDGQVVLQVLTSFDCLNEMLPSNATNMVRMSGAHKTLPGVRSATKRLARRSWLASAKLLKIQGTFSECAFE